MSDAGLRDLERRARAGEAEAREPWLRARLRVGQVSLLRVELAAACGDLAARSALGLCSVHDFTSAPEDQPWNKCHEGPDGSPTPSPIHVPGRLCLDKTNVEFATDLVSHFAHLTRRPDEALVRAAAAVASHMGGEGEGLARVVVLSLADEALVPEVRDLAAGAFNCPLLRAFTAIGNEEEETNALIHFIEDAALGVGWGWDPDYAEAMQATLHRAMTEALIAWALEEP
jgi:hypothetical protein